MKKKQDPTKLLYLGRAQQAAELVQNIVLLEVVAKDYNINIHEELNIIKSKIDSIQNKLRNAYVEEAIK